VPGQVRKIFWEGIILKRKLAALITLIAFAVTMIPSMAFAAAKPATADASYFVTDDANDDNDNVKLNETVLANFEINDNGDDATDETLKDVYIWVTDEDGVVSSALNAYKDEAGTADIAKGDIANTYKLDATNDTSVYLAFAREGTYKIHAGVLENTVSEPTVADLTKLKSDSDNNTIVVKQDEDDVTGMTLVDNNVGWKVLEKSTDAEASTYMGYASDNLAFMSENSNKTAEIGYVSSNGVAQKQVRVKLWKGDKVAKDEKVTISTSSSNLVANKTEETTNRQGYFNVKVSAKKAGTYKLYIDSDDYKGVIKITAQEMNPDEIETISEPSAPLDKDTDWNDAETVGDDIQLEIRDTKGYVISGELDQYATSSDKKDRKDYIKIVSQPDDSDLDGEDFRLVPVPDGDGGYEDYYTLVTTEDLEEGTYTVKVALDNGASDEVTWKVAKFGTAQTLKINFDAQTVPLADTDVSPKSVKIVDQNGVERNIKASDDVTFGYTGYAIENFKTINDGLSFKFDVKDDEKYLGQTVTFTAVSEDKGLAASADIVIAADGQSLTFDPTSGAVDEDNKVNVQVVDGADKTVAPGDGSKTYAYVVSQSNPEAKVDVEVDSESDLAKKGQAKLTVTSDKEGTAEIQVYVKGGNGKMYANTLNYTFGAAPSGADLNVVMTINSAETIVNNKIVTIDAAPYVNADSRTMVPIRALAEDFGATVDWNADTQTVTVKLDGNTVEMTIGSTTYKVNGTEKTMDTAPVIKDGRTFVPVRFVAEALGFKVTPTYNADGTTASVVFAR
jgi:hypothetical protein